MTIPEIVDNNGRVYSDFTFFKKGGMGEIYRGRENQSGRDVALKLIPFASSEEEALLQTELDVSRRLSHKNIASSFHTGKVSISGTDYLFLVQDFYKNGNMRSRIVVDLPIDQCFNMIFDILNGMSELHKSIVHRDLKPENVLVGSEGELVVADFGLAKYIDEKTRTRSFKGYGTVPYMSPECWAGDTNTVGMDIYALGIMFFEILTGRLPFTAGNELEWRECHLFSPFPSLLAYRSGVSTKLDQVIQKMSNKRTAQRYRTVDEVMVAMTEAKSIISRDAGEAERLAALGNITLQTKKAQELKTEKEQERIAEWIKFLNFEITELFNRLRQKVDAVNEQLEDGKVVVSERIATNHSTARNLAISFEGKSVQVSFGEWNAIDVHNNMRKKRARDLQRERNFGVVVYPPSDSYFKVNNFVLFGLAETGFKIGDVEFGFNLLLRKIEGSQYGEWKLLQFSENVTPPRTKFGINLSGFQEDYEKISSSIFHTTTLRDLTDEDLVSLLEKVLL